MMFAIHEFRVVRYLSHLFISPSSPNQEYDHWVEFAQTLPRAPFIVWLANEVAAHLITKKPHNLSLETLIDSVDDDTSDSMQHEAERFLEHQFGLFRYDPNYSRIIVVFRHLVQHKLRHRRPPQRTLLA
jgi:hypothetical protein